MMATGTNAQCDPDNPVLLLVRIDLTNANIETFEKYEDIALSCLKNYGGSIMLRVRSTENGWETHLVSFPGEAAYQRYKEDPLRVDAQRLWFASGAVSAIEFVRFV
jgi:hypothetical protein